MIPYGRHSINEDDIAEVDKVLRSDWLTQGEKVGQFEKELADYCGAKYAVAVANGTAAIHTAFFAAGLARGAEFITSPMTFVATSNVGLWQGAKPVFVDIDESTGNIDVDKIEEKITKNTKAIVPIDYTGRPVELAKIKAIARKHNLIVIEDACQALGAQYADKKIGSVSDLTVFSFHPVKSITTGEGGAILTDNEDYYKKMKIFITHGIVKNNFVNEPPGSWYFEMQELGQNYRLTDIQCALGISQIKRLDQFIEKRRMIAARYDIAFKDWPKIQIPANDDETHKSSWHLYVIRLKNELAKKRNEIFNKMREAGVGVQVHHIPVYLHPYYQKLGYKKGICPKTEIWYESALSLPIYPDLKEAEQDYVISKLKLIVG